jgi:hypothetical protein
MMLPISMTYGRPDFHQRDNADGRRWRNPYSVRRSAHGPPSSQREGPPS